MRGHGPVNEGMVGRAVAPHEFHRGPIFPARIGVQPEPGQMPQVAGQFRMQAPRQCGKVFGHFPARAPAATVRQQRQIHSRRQSGHVQGHVQHAPLHEMVARAAGAKLRPGGVAHARRDRGEAPVLVHDRVVLADLKFTADPEAGLLLNGLGQLVAVGIDQLRGEGEDAHLHPAGDVHAHPVRDDRIVHSQDPADGQAVADMGIGHERPAHGHGEARAVAHLLHSLGVEILPPGSPGSLRLGQDCLPGCPTAQHPGQGAKDRMLEKRPGIIRQTAEQTTQGLAPHALVFQLAHALQDHGHEPLGYPQSG